MPAIIQAVIHVGDRFWAIKNRCPKNLKIIFFQDKLYSLKAHTHYFTVIISYTYQIEKLVNLVFLLILRP